MVYSPPNLSQLRTNVARDLRDPTFAAFSVAELNDYINNGIAELNELHPVEVVLHIVDIASFADLGLDSIFKVVSSTVVGVGEDIIPPNNDETLYPNGWTYFAGDLILPAWMMPWYSTQFDAGTIALTIYGYGRRDPVTNDTDVAAFASNTEEQAVRQFARWRGLDALSGDRRLFQQWQTQANNSDVSPTQLANMEMNAGGEWAQTRRRIYTIRRPAVGW